MDCECCRRRCGESVLSVGAWLYYARRAQALAGKTPLCSATSQLTTGDAIFDDTLKTGLSVSLRQSPFLNVLSDSEVTKTLQLMTRPDDTKLHLRWPANFASGRAAKHLAGSIGSLGSQYVLGLKAVNCRSGDTLAEEQADHHLKGAGHAGPSGNRTAQRAGRIAEHGGRVRFALEQATTSSLKLSKPTAWDGRTQWARADSAAAVPFFQRAVQLDPNFAMAYASLGTSYWVVAETSLGGKHEEGLCTA